MLSEESFLQFFVTSSTLRWNLNLFCAPCVMRLMLSFSCRVLSFNCVFQDYPVFYQDPPRLGTQTTACSPNCMFIWISLFFSNTGNQFDEDHVLQSVLQRLFEGLPKPQYDDICKDLSRFGACACLCCASLCLTARKLFQPWAKQTHEHNKPYKHEQAVVWLVIWWWKPRTWRPINRSWSNTTHGATA